MMSADLFHFMIWTWMAVAILLIPIQIKYTAPYGRHLSKGWGGTMDNKWGWVIMEVVSPLCFAWFFLTGDNEISFPMWVFFTCWMVHYLNRSLIFPLRIRTSGKQIPVIIVLSAIFFNLFNGWTNGYYLGTLTETYPTEWLYSPQFIIGLTLFATGMYINIDSDNILIRLRQPGRTGYRIPRGGLFKKVSCPNHFGEMMEWVGFALMCWNLAALAFAVWTIANLIPRAMSHHRWYRSHFFDYPDNRKAVIPNLL